MDGLLIRELEEAAALGDGHLIPVDQGADAKKATMSQVATYIANKNIGSIFGLPVASVFYNPSTSASDVRGCVRGDNGGYYETASTTIPDLYVYIKAHSELCKTKSEYDALYTLNGFVDYYVIDEVEGSLRLPKYTKLTVKETMKWADRVSFVNNTAAPFDCIAFVGIPQQDKMHYVYLTPKDGEEFQLTHNGYSNDGPDSISVRLNTGDKLRANVTSELNGWWVPIVCQTLNLIPWIVAQHQETPEGEIALLSITTAPSGSFAVGSKYFNSSDSLIYTAVIPNTWTGATTAAPVFSAAYLFGGNFYLWTGSGLMLRPAEGGGSGGGGTAATTSFEPTATINATNVQDAVVKVDAKAESVAGDLADTEINGVAIAGKNNTCDDLGLQCEIEEGNNITKTQISESAIKLLLKFTTADGFKDISASPLTFSFSGSAVYGDPLYSNSTNKSLRLRRYDQFHVNKPSGADWSKINAGTGPFTIKFRRKCSSAAYSGSGKLLSVNNTASPYNALCLNGSIMGITPTIAITENAIEEILLTRLENGTFKYYKNGQELGTSEALNGVALDFSDWGYGFITEYGQFEDYVSGLSLSNKAYTGGNYTPSEDYQTLDAITKDVFACKNYFGEIYTADNSTAQTIPTGATYTKSTAFNTAGKYRGVTLDAANNKIILPSAGYYKVGVTGSSKLGSAGITLKTALFLNGVKVPNCQSIRKVNNANDESTVSFGGIVKVDTANSEIDVRVAHDQGGDVSLTTVFCSLNALYIGDLAL